MQISFNGVKRETQMKRTSLERDPNEKDNTLEVPLTKRNITNISPMLNG